MPAGPSQPPAVPAAAASPSPDLQQAKQVYLAILDKIESGQDVAKQEYDALGRAAQILDSAGVSEDFVLGGRTPPKWNRPPAPKASAPKQEQTLSPQTRSLAEKNLPTVETQEQYDGLPSGALFLDKQGRIWRKR